jgi:hypothetical protein
MSTTISVRFNVETIITCFSNQTILTTTSGTMWLPTVQTFPGCISLWSTESNRVIRQLNASETESFLVASAEKITLHFTMKFAYILDPSHHNFPLPSCVAHVLNIIRGPISSPQTSPSVVLAPSADSTPEQVISAAMRSSHSSSNAMLGGSLRYSQSPQDQIIESRSPSPLPHHEEPPCRVNIEDQPQQVAPPAITRSNVLKPRPKPASPYQQRRV